MKEAVCLTAPIRAPAFTVSSLAAPTRTAINNESTQTIVSPSTTAQLHQALMAIASGQVLPPDLAITARSRKFYDGTYRWDSDGFTDEHGGKHSELAQSFG